MKTAEERPGEGRASPASQAQGCGAEWQLHITRHLEFLPPPCAFNTDLPGPVYITKAL